jgi:hypothetical protein
MLMMLMRRQELVFFYRVMDSLIPWKICDILLASEDTIHGIQHRISAFNVDIKKLLDTFNHL